MKILWRLFLSFNRGTQIGLCVLLTHFLFLFCLMGHHFFTKKKSVSNRIAVRTYAPPKPMVKPAKDVKAITDVKPATSSKKSAPKNSAKSIQKSTPKTNPKKEAVKSGEKEEQLIDEIAKSLDTFSTQTKAKQELAIPQIVPAIEAETDLIVEDPASIISFLQNVLSLPEYGDVVVKIEIGKQGDLLSCEILDAKSKKNGEFLKKRLPELHFPCFNREITFTITFRNVETL